MGKIRRKFTNSICRKNKIYDRMYIIVSNRITKCGNRKSRRNVRNYGQI